MKVEVFTIGRPRLGFVRAGVEEYAKRLKRYANFAWHPVADEARLLARSQGALRVALDERGEEPTTDELAERVRRWRLTGVKRVAFLVGGAEGHSRALLGAADWTMALSRLTLQHELALLLLLEQLYRVETLLAGHPYHRG